MAKRLIVAKSAYLHLDRIIEFNNVRNHSNTYSNKIVRALFKQFHLLEKSPYRGKFISENSYVLIWDKFYIFYLVKDDSIEVNAIYHQKENINF
ncbi:type II toxin-antitoxin system RelE/ParE family toxin [Mucilaginibacter limnophilus]|uniref:Type II toxin-antitoxin system RelE/ParE family toxin n=1 Tax=Mucilaginibacter limnophilus TaxID=1932778 RepID=A0A3S2Y4D3_9SPHI|nr:type II toxin-antitoxin system RelE/ParE family toxin [Mucilaginibacter limnophilus]